MLPQTFHTARLKLRPIVPEDAGPIFDGYAQDTTVTRFVIWRPHRSRSDTDAYIAQCIATPPDVSRTYVLTDRTNGDAGYFCPAPSRTTPSRLRLRFGASLVGPGPHDRSPHRGCELGFEPAWHFPHRRCMRCREHRLRTRDGE